MPRIELPGLAGPSNVLSSLNVDAERTINWYPESVASGTPRTGVYLRPTPGCHPFATFTTAPVRGLFEQDGRCFGVSGTGFGEIDSGGTVTEFTPAVEDDADHTSVTFCSNGSAGSQVMFTSAGNGYVFDLLTNTLTLIQDLDADFPDNVAMCAFMDGYGIVLIADSREFRISALEDFTSWDPLDVFQRSIGSDNIVTMIRNHRSLELLGSQTSESWYDAGDPLIPFQPTQGVLAEQGSAARFGAVRADNTFCYLVKDERGTGVASRQEGFVPQRMSTYAIDRRIQASTNLAGAVAMALQMDGHLFVAFDVPGLDTTLYYDVAEKLWHERALWNSTTCQWEPHIGKYHAFAFGKHLIGSRANAIVYHMDATFLEDGLIA